jgi:hypothetical protein
VPVLLYHWRVLRQDQHLGAEKLLPAKTVTLLASERASGLASRIEQKLGSGIRLLRHLDETPEDMPDLSDEELDNLVTRIETAPGNKVMLVVVGDKVMVLPYRE